MLCIADQKVTVTAKKEKVDTEQIQQQDKEDAWKKELKEEKVKDAELKREQEEQEQDVAKEVDDIAQADVLNAHPEPQDSVACFEMEYSRFKNNLLKYHCATIGERDCMKDAISKWLETLPRNVKHLLMIATNICWWQVWTSSTQATDWLYGHVTQYRTKAGWLRQLCQ